MINQHSLSSLVDSLLLVLNNHHPFRRSTSFEVNYFHQKNLYLGQFEERVELSKVNITQFLLKLKESEGERRLNHEEGQCLSQLKNCFKQLNADLLFLLQEGILNVYLDFSEVREKISPFTSSILQKLLKDIGGCIQQLVRDFFVYQEYQNCGTTRTRVKSHGYYGDFEFSTPHGRDHKQNVIDMQLLRRIQKDLKNRPIHELIEDYMQRQIIQIKQQEEICRICSQKFKLKTIEKHVKLCQKQFDLKEKYSTQKAEYQVLRNKVKQISQKLNEKVIKSEEEESLKKVISVFLKEGKSKKENKLNRSESLQVIKFENNISWGWDQYLFQHQDQFGQCEVLSSILVVQRQKSLIQRNLRSIQRSLLAVNTESESTIDSNNLEFFAQKSNTSMMLTQSSKSNMNISQATSKKLDRFEEKDCILSDIDSCHSISEQLANEVDTKGSSFADKLKSFKTKKTMKKFDQNQTESIQNRSVSLQDITILEDQNNVALENFQIIKVLGKGAYGEVYMVRRKGTDHIYALKIVKFTQNCSDKELKTIQTEHQIFRKIAGEHLIKAPFSFSEKQSHIFVLEFMPGGDLRNLLQREVYFEEDAARFYLAEVVLAIEHLHKSEFIHRDLKPQNLVIDSQGHLKLTDFGLSSSSIEKMLKESQIIHERQQVRRTNKRRVGVSFNNPMLNLIGTPDYIAPEIINRISTKNKSVDWWSLGVLAYELLIGTRPFCANTIQEVIQNILNFNIQWPDVGDQEGMVSVQAKDLIDKLLDKDFTRRLGANGVQQIKNHPFFKGVNWSFIKYETPPFQPNLTQVYKESQLPENKKLRLQVEERLGREIKVQKKFKLQKFVRYDLLGTETMQNVSKIYSEQTGKLTKLRTCKKFQLLKSEKVFKGSESEFQ